MMVILASLSQELVKKEGYTARSLGGLGGLLNPYFPRT
jgi:hypothetical protein